MKEGTKIFAGNGVRERPTEAAVHSRTWGGKPSGEGRLKASRRDLFRSNKKASHQDRTGSPFTGGSCHESRDELFSGQQKDF